jgi:hypothetical protein
VKLPETLEDAKKIKMSLQGHGNLGLLAKLEPVL